LQRAFLALFLLTSIHLASAQAPSAPGKPLPPGPMQAKIKAACLQCHNASRITEQRLTRHQWSQELDKMEGLGAVIQEAERTDMLEYLTKNFGPSKPGAKTAIKKSD
jgi:Spy/CpxP family protein refolding chaperone